MVEANASMNLKAFEMLEYMSFVLPEGFEYKQVRNGNTTFCLKREEYINLFDLLCL